MAIIPLSLKLSWYDPSQPTGVVTAVNDNVNQATTAATQYTMQDIIDTVSFTGGAIDGSGTANEIAVFTDTNTISSISNGSAGQLLTSNGAGSDPSFSIATGTSGQLLVSNGAGSNPSFQTVTTGVPSSSVNVDAIGYPFLQGLFLENDEWLVFDNGNLSAQESTEPDGHNELLAVPNNPGTNEFFNPLNYGLGFGSGLANNYNLYDIIINPFKYSDFTTSGGPGGWACGTINVGDPQYIWTNVMVASYGYSPTDPNRPISQSRFIGEVVCSNGVVPIQMAQYISCDVSAIGVANLAGWVAYDKVYAFDFANSVAIHKITIFFAGTTANVTVI